MMNIVMLGPQGSGKGTQAKFISEKFNIPHISTGDIFRKNITEETELGKLASSFINKGELVPDEVTNKLVESRIKDDDCNGGFILDGFPRNLSQAEFLDSITNINKSIDIEIPDKEVVFRLEGRRTCTNKECGAIYNVNTSPKPKDESKCDKPEAIKKRLEIYHNETSPLIDYYGNKDVLKKIDGMQSIKKVFEDIVSALE